MLILSIVTYMLCLVFVPFGGWPGWVDLLFGWLTVGHGISSLCWFANPTLFLSWELIASKSYKDVAVCSSIIALVLACSFMFMDSSMEGEGPPFPVGPLGLRYWLWLTSILGGLLSALISHRNGG